MRDKIHEFYSVQKGIYYMDLAKQAQIIDNIHDKLSEYVGQKLRVKANMGRSKIIESEGVLMQVHPQLFIMEVQRKRGVSARQSYQYVDVLTGMVELSQNGEQIFGTFIEEETDEEEVVATEATPAVEGEVKQPLI
jgi:uncharacterized protein Veg